jgi:hypothetical protein
VHPGPQPQASVFEPAAVDGTVVALFAPPRLYTLADGGGDVQAGEQVGPGPAQPGVEDQEDEQDRGQVGAQQRMDSTVWLWQSPPSRIIVTCRWRGRAPGRDNRSR